MLDEIESKLEDKDEEGDRQRKKSKTLSKVKPVENISKNLIGYSYLHALFITIQR